MQSAGGSTVTVPLRSTAANGDTLIAEPVLTPTSDPAVVRAVGNFVGGTGRFTGATGTLSVELIFANDQGDFVYEDNTSITLQHPWNRRGA